jgi:hypothetical protein
MIRCRNDVFHSSTQSLETRIFLNGLVLEIQWSNGLVWNHEHLYKNSTLNKLFILHLFTTFLYIVKCKTWCAELQMGLQCLPAISGRATGTCGVWIWQGIASHQYLVFVLERPSPLTNSNRHIDGWAGGRRSRHAE